MTLRQYLLMMSIGTIICWLIWILVVGNIDPKETGSIGFIFFYVSLFLALIGTFSVIGFLIRKKIIKYEVVVFHHVRHTFRQGLLISLLILIAMMMLQFKLLTWWTGVLVVLLFLVLESIIFANRKHKNRDYIS